MDLGIVYNLLIGILTLPITPDTYRVRKRRPS